jgi:hypothetical protein
VMVIILSSFGSVPLSSVVICWTIVATIVNMSFRDELFALGAWTDLVLVGCASREGRPSQLKAAEAAGVAVCPCVSLPRRIVPGWCGWKRTPSPL